jgi:hypothetical protein
MTRVNTIYGVVVYLVFAIAVLVIGVVALTAFPGVLLLFLAILFGFLLGRKSVIVVHTDKQPLQSEK